MEEPKLATVDITEVNISLKSTLMKHSCEMQTLKAVN